MAFRIHFCKHATCNAVSQFQAVLSGPETVLEQIGIPPGHVRGLRDSFDRPWPGPPIPMSCNVPAGRVAAAGSGTCSPSR